VTLPCTLSVLPGGRAPSLRRSVATPRIRPGEYPVWCELDLLPEQQERLRQRAQRHGVGADAFVGIAFEYLLLRKEVGDDHFAALLAAATRELERRTITAAPEFRVWQRLLETGKPPLPPDELPAICIPMRLLSQLPVPRRMQALHATTQISGDEARAGLLLEIGATRHGLTMASWALRLLTADPTLIR
jgi:hypothetical protein